MAKRKKVAAVKTVAALKRQNAALLRLVRELKHRLLTVDLAARSHMQTIRDALNAICHI
jgi:hypothetical protein